MTQVKIYALAVWLADYLEPPTKKNPPSNMVLFERLVKRIQEWPLLHETL